MAYEKLYLVVRDSPVGYQHVNQLAANFAETVDNLFEQHGENEPIAVQNPPPGPTGVDWDSLGRHNIVEIPKSVGYSVVYAQTPTVQSSQLRNNGPAIPYVWKLATGEYVLQIIGLTFFWAKVSVLNDDASLVYLDPIVRPFYPSAANNYNAGVQVRTRTLSGGDFVATDASFAIAIHGRP